VLSTAGKQRKESRDVSRQSRSGVFVGVFVLVWCFLVLLFLILSEFTDVVSSCSTRTGIHTMGYLEVEATDSDVIPETDGPTFAR
jgi:hypothetical protein